jgi:DNA mismatch repair protein MutS2
LHPAVPDLLCAEPAVRVEVSALRTALVFAFAAGGSPEVFDELIAGARLSPSTWDRSDFARDVYLDDLVSRCLPVRIGGKTFPACTRYIARVLAEPPRARADVETRRAVLSELTSSGDRRAELEKVYLSIVRLRALLCTARALSQRGRRVEVLRAAREVFETLATSFDGAESALSRLRAFGAEVVAAEAHGRVVQLLDHEEHQGSLELRVRVGADGEVRAMQIVGVSEDTSNPFHVSALQRFLTRILLFFRGWRTTRDEVAERLLSEVFAGIEDPVAQLFQLLGDIEPYLASLGLRDRASAEGLAMSLPELVDERTPPGGMVLEGLFNPLLLAAGVHPIACDVRAAPGAVVLVTGPNSGGKTRLLQAIAIAQIFAEAGLLVPVRAGRILRAPGLFASLYEEPRADAPEGHLGMELLRIRRLFDQLDVGAVVVLDELCAGTNPSEGEEIARLVLSLLPELGVQAFVTTHLLQFAARLAQERSPSADGVAQIDFLQVELDELERPTYRFVPGVAKTSLAAKTAARLGVTREELLERIESKKRSRGEA